MDRRSVCPLLLLALIAGWSGCNSSATKGSYELVEQPQGSPAAPATPPAVEEQVVATPTVAETTQLNEPPATPPEVKPEVVQQAVTETPKPLATTQIASAADPARPEAAVALEPLTASPDALKSLIPNKIELKVPHKDFSREGREKALRVSYDDLDLLKVLNMEPVPLNAEEYLPGWLKSLNGEKVRLRGWMFPPLMTEGLPAFLFVRDNQICCFGREAKVYDKVRVTMKEGTTTDYIFGRPFDVIGTFHIESEERDGELYFLYSIDDAVVMK
ncbi:hypothetical protein Pan44_30200 [Caulifigura coniformis]|uniref:DUF3299 domain-containing protein n=1 Tax=Caulifigura coniformis TaxID=2527983 RepID=A0A517SFT7_9PLAN|nr:hypothetical protein [Caulifigura coniformis]QDT54979.1 hypothetical protein Pan44_30200 [Caulifigura coniformis]